MRSVNMPGSDKYINYQLRPAKSVERKMICNLIKQIQVLGNRAWVDCVEKIGYETFKKIVDVFNEKKKCEILANKEKYLNDRNNISPDVSSLFKEALRLIRLYEKEISFSNENDLITKHIIKFFLSPDLKEQVDAALNITGFFNNFYNQSIVSKKI